MKTLSLRVTGRKDLAWAERVRGLAAEMGVTVSIMTGQFDESDELVDLIAVSSDERELWPKSWKAWVALSKGGDTSRLRMSERRAFRNGANMCYGWPEDDEAIRLWLNQISKDIPTD